jgi:putative tricarboxylic transport membrane protein
MSRYKDAATGLFSVVLGLALFVLSFQVKDFASIGVGAGFLPRLAAILFVALGASLAAKDFAGARSAPRTGAKASADADASGRAGAAGGSRQVYLSILLLCAYAALLQPVGFIITSALFIFFQTVILSKGLKRNYLLFGVVSVVSSVVAYFLFVRVFQVMIPAGILG